MELLERFTKGDIEAFEILFRQFQNDVYRWIFRIVREPSIAEELTVETFWRIHRSHARFDASRSFGAWARQIAINAAFDHLKRSKREAEFQEEPADEKFVDPAVQKDSSRRIRHAFAQLPPKLQVTAILALIEEMPYEEIAEMQNIPVGTVKSRVFKATRLLRERLKRQGFEP